MSFDIDTYISHSASLVTDDLDFESFRENPLDADTLRCLRYMHDVEFHTVCYLRDLLVTRAHADPEITTFLTFWAWEEHFHGEALARVLAVHDEMAGRARVSEARLNAKLIDRFKPLFAMTGSMLVKDLVAVQMTWGAINEWTTQSGYARVIARSDNPVLSILLRRIMKQEGKHIDFYSTQATARLERSATARRVTRSMLKNFWSPVGSGVMPKAEVAFLIDHLFNSDDGRSTAERIDRHMDRLPGLSGLHLVSKAVDKYVVVAA